MTRSQLLERTVPGAQAPRVRSTPGTAVSSAADDVADLCASADFTLDGWQHSALTDILGETAAFRWAARESGFVVSRQNGKGGILHALALAGLFLFDEVKEILHSAHEFKTAKKAYRELRELIKGTPHLYARVERRGSRVVGFRNSNEDTSITLQDGSVIRFMARSSNTGRGFSPQWLIIDEAQECSEETRQALRYTVRAQVNPLIVWCGTAPHPTKNNSEAFTSLRDRGRSGKDKSLVWLEWSPDPDTDIAALRNDDALFDQVAGECNPALGTRITIDTIREERDACTTEDAWEGFCREALSWWPDAAEGLGGWDVWTAAEWMACATNENEDQAAQPGWLTGTVTLAVEMDAEKDNVTIGAGGTCREGGFGFDVVHRVRGETAAVAKIVQLAGQDDVGRVMIDKRGPARTLIDPLTEAGVDVYEVSSEEFITGTRAMFNAVLAREVKHRNRAEINEAVEQTVKRRIGDSFLLDRRTGVDISPVNVGILCRIGHLLGDEIESTTSLW